jgi:hypothetical protein
MSIKDLTGILADVERHTAPATVKAAVEAIRSSGLSRTERWDYAAALQRHVLESIASGSCSDPARCAAEVLAPVIR